MKPWAEDNYLERLMPQLQQAKRVNMESCPDSDLLAAYTEDQVSPFVRGAITAHLTHCSECSDVCARLESFARAGVPEQDREWVNAEKRLDNWAESFLNSLTAKSRVQQEVPSSPLLQWKEATRAASSFWKLGWAVGAVAALGLIVGGLLVTKRGTLAGIHLQGPSQVAVEQAPPAPISNPATSLNSAPAPASNSAEFAPAASEAVASAQKPPAAISRPGPAVGSARSARVAAPPSTEVASATNPEIRQDNPAPASGQNNDAAQDATQVAESQNVPDQTTNGHPPSRSAAQPVDPVRRVNVVSSTPANANPVPPAPLPAVIKLDSGARLFFRVDSINRQRDGSFTFRGSLLQPATLADGARPLDKGTELNGSGTEKDGKLTAFVRNFVLQGVSYDVSGANGPVNDQTPGAGKAVEFENGGALEMWLSSASTYLRPR